MKNISWSLGETDALALKAARGAGMPWGLAEEAGHAVVWLTQRGVSGVAALCRHLIWYQKNGMQAAKNCPIVLGATISDGGIVLPADLEMVRAPLLLVPFIAARLDEPAWSLQIKTITIEISHHGFSSQSVDTALLIDQAPCRITATSLSPNMIEKHKASAIMHRVHANASACIATLEMFAHRTYAPSTEQSRLAGAGSGLSDND